jgi:uncharacterized protein (UPF0332 family)
LNNTQTEGTFQDVSLYKYEQAKDDLDTAKLLLQAGKYKAANNRAYYACFHALTSVLALEPIAFKRHKDVIGYFNKNYIHTDIFPKDIGRKISNMEIIRHKSDYDTFYIAGKEESIEQVEAAADIIDLVGKYLEEKKNEGETK